MDRWKAIQNLSQTLPDVFEFDSKALIHQVIEWLEQTEVCDNKCSAPCEREHVEEVKDALERLEDRTCRIESLMLFSDRSGYVDPSGEAIQIQDWDSVVEAIDSIHPEPSDEPPSPDEIAGMNPAGELVPLKNGYYARVWWRELRNCFLGVAEQDGGDFYCGAWEKSGKLAPSLDNSTDIDWQQWRKERG